jgi:hypothetical protein
MTVEILKIQMTAKTAVVETEAIVVAAMATRLQPLLLWQADFTRMSSLLLLVLGLLADVIVIVVQIVT